ncbi:hypothetical protein [Oryza sativa Japonica Group]|uniref:Uncharacterized protein P0413G02.26 n=1 Tax=Oryza sativa subsp. japonica TaxID=39947 RepID=Q8LJ37_ORYSJ|nr:hypothetical protein [Oryza sativa Japonica Group]
MEGAADDGLMGRGIPASTPLGTGANVGARSPVRSDVTGNRPTVRVLRIDGGSAWASSPLAPLATWRLPEGLGARQREGPRGVTWHPEAS